MSSSELPADTSRPVNWLAGAEAVGMFVLIMAYIWWLRFRYPYAWALMLLMMFASHQYRRETLATLGFKWSHPAHALAPLSARRDWISPLSRCAGYHQPSYVRGTEVVPAVSVCWAGVNGSP
jgi:hypothetical protein